jgi:hypothetical protein
MKTSGPKEAAKGGLAPQILVAFFFKRPSKKVAEKKMLTKKRSQNKKYKVQSEDYNSFPARISSEMLV